MAAFNLPPVSMAFVAICKKAYVPLVNENDELLISNWAAIEAGLRALNKQDADDEVRAEQLWAKAKRKLITEQENLVGAGAQGTIQIQDDFDMASVGGEMDCSWGYR